ncbi:hypothetical protein P691DRAFT_809829 [Macrolepiota fuliginosa MF-IS2]|uniref:Uncharacterized protein n=1 Tax=Macrolepiota fuliginosa MF-IS2 TaxID=1400762 RepID=A0A9P6CAN7_9AGAR|nr:hypothetical protein P691DRAFT_809829 [Macrolepiota fuliginosa MF-IS2]
MSIIARDPHFSWSAPLANDDISEESSYTPSTHASHTKQFERRIVKMWKTLTCSTRKQKRVSVYAKDFVFVTAAASRKRSIMALQQAQPQFQLASQPAPRSDTRGHHTF